MTDLHDKEKGKEKCRCKKCKTTCVDCSFGWHDYPRPLKVVVAEAIEWGFTLGYECKMSGNKNKEYNERLRKHIKKTIKSL